MIRVGEIAALLGGEPIGNTQLSIARIGPLESAQADSISFLANPRYRARLDASLAGCVIVAPDLRDAVVTRPAAILCDDPYLGFARLTQWWAARTRRVAAPGIHRTAVVEPGAQVHPGASVGALAFVGADAVVGEGVVIGAQSHVGEGAQLGEGTRLMARVSFGDGCRIGARGLVHPGAVIGADGFGFAPDGGHWAKIEQLGSVVIGDDVEIGANSCIDRGALEDTVIGDGVKIDNLVQVGHNVRIGPHCALAGCVGIAGSARIGAHCTFGGGAIVLGHLDLTDHVHVSAATVVTRSILKPGHYTGMFPFDDNASWEKNAATLRQLHALRDRLRALEKNS